MHSTALTAPRVRVSRHAVESHANSLGSVAVAGATGKTGRLVVEELLRSGCASEVIALVRNTTKAQEVLGSNKQTRIVLWDLSDEATGAGCHGADAAVWCAESEGLSSMSNVFAAKGEFPNGQPRLVMCSSAAATRPIWSDAKKQRFSGVADIPIVRLNPNDILGAKRAAEDVVRQSGVSYAIVRPTGLNDNWPSGRPILSQGDFAVGRISRADLASLLVSLLREPHASGKTFEAVSVAGYPKPVDGYAQVLARLRKDRKQGPLEDVRAFVSRIFRGDESTSTDEATYGLLQQLLPGEAQNSAGLAMGQTYEQYDEGKEGRLGRRGEERVPPSITG